MNLPESAEPVLRLWNFDDAPLDLRRLAPVRYPGGWIAHILPSDRELLELLFRGGRAAGRPVLAIEVEAWGTIVVGPAVGSLPPDASAGLDS